MILLFRHKSRGSAVISSALIIISIMFLLIFSFQGYTGLMRKKSKKYEQFVKARNLAYSAAEAAAFILECTFKNDSALEKKILAGYEGPLNVFFDDPFFAGMSMKAEIKRDQYILDPSDETCGFNANEVRGSITVHTSARSGSTDFSLKRIFNFSIVSPLIPVVSAFTLFMPGAGQLGPEYYNVCRNSIDGTLNDNSLVPLVLDNQNSSKPSELLFSQNSGPASQGSGLNNIVNNEKQGGLVYLGRSRVNLNISSGPSGYGEDFLHYNIDQRKRPVYYINSNAPASLLVPHNPTPFAPAQAWFILHSFHGFYSSDKSVYESGMQRSPEYSFYFKNFKLPGRTGAESSWLRLFGSIENTLSPTLVYGNVYSRMAMMSALGIDVDSTQDDEKAQGITGRDIDALVVTLPMSGTGHFQNALKQVPQFPFRPFPEIIKNRNDSKNEKYKNIYINSHEINYFSIFNTFDVYKNYMSRIFEIPYNCMLDFMNYSNEIKNDFQARLLESVTLTVKSDDTRGVYFSGSLENAKAEGILKKVQITYKDEKDFLKNHIVKGDLDLGCCVYIKQGSLNLPHNLKVISGGAIICNENIYIKGIKNSSDLGLSLVSLKGDFIIHTFSGPVDAGLCTLSKNGRILSSGRQTRKEKLRIKGHLAVSMLDPYEFSKGAYIEYDHKFNPLTEDFSKLLFYFSSRSAEIDFF